MKNFMIYRIKFLIVLLLNYSFAIGGSDGLVRSDDSYRKETFGFKGGKVTVVNKFGDVTVKSWDKDSVAVEVVVHAEASNPDHLDLMMKMASARIYSTAGNVYSELNWGDEVGGIKQGTIEVALSLKSEYKLRIDQIIHVPKNAKLSIENRFGDVLLPSLEQELRLTLHHGALRAESLYSLRAEELKYAKIDLIDLKKLEGKIVFSEVLIKNCDQADIQTSSSEIELDLVKDLRVKSSNDKYRIENAGTIIGSSFMGDWRVRTVKGGVDLDMKFGSFDLRNLQTPLKTVHLIGSNTEFRIGFSDDFSGSVKVEGEKVKTLSNSSGILREKEKYEGSGRIEYEFSTEKSGQGMVSITGKSLKVYLMDGLD